MQKTTIYNISMSSSLNNVRKLQVLIDYMMPKKNSAPVRQNLWVLVNIFSYVNSIIPFEY